LPWVITFTRAITGLKEGFDEFFGRQETTPDLLRPPRAERGQITEGAEELKQVANQSNEVVKSMEQQRAIINEEIVNTDLLNTSLINTFGTIENQLNPAMSQFNNIMNILNPVADELGGKLKELTDATQRTVTGFLSAHDRLIGLGAVESTTRAAAGFGFRPTTPGQATTLGRMIQANIKMKGQKTTR